ncbi:MAG: hypothetical protein ACE5ER_08030, partial [Nitrospinaceae bacterium]
MGPHPAAFLVSLLRHFGFDHAVAFAMMSKIWQLLAAPVTLLLIAQFLTPEQQGYYYTFMSLVALQSFLELGFYLVIIQFASHEWSLLSMDGQGRLTGDALAQSRLASLGRLVLKWYSVASSLFISGVGLAGYWFLQQKENPEIQWQAPWLVLIVIAGIQLWTLPFLSLLEGCNQVKQIYRIRFFQTLTATLVIWVCLAAGGQLWTAAAGIFAGLLMVLYQLYIRYEEFFISLFTIRPDTVISWKKEILPMQWRLAAKGLVAYFLFSIYTPIMFHLHGPVVAGQMGLTWQLVTAAETLAISWILTKAPQFGMLASKKNYEELNPLFFRVSIGAMGMIICTALGLWGLVYALNYFEHPLANRMLSPMPTGIFVT